MSEPDDNSRSAREPWFRPEDDAWRFGQPTPPEPEPDRTGWQQQLDQGAWARQSGGSDQTGLHPSRSTPAAPQRFQFTQPSYGQPPASGHSAPDQQPPGQQAPGQAGPHPRQGPPDHRAHDSTGDWFTGTAEPFSAGSPAYVGPGPQGLQGPAGPQGPMPAGPGSQPTPPPAQSQPSPYAYNTVHPSAVFPPQQPDGEQPAAPRGRSIGLKAVAAMVIGAVALAGVIMLGISQVQRMTSPQTIAPPATEGLSRPAPPGWSKDYAWSVDTTARSLAVGENRVAYVDGSGSLHLLDADTGRALFTSPTTDASADAEPFIAMARGVPVTGMVSGQQLYLWQLNARNSAEPHQVTLAPKAQLYQQGGGLLVATKTERWVVSPTGALDPVTLPSDHVALAVTPDGNMLSAPPRGSWMFSSPNAGVAPEVVRPQSRPAEATGDMQVVYSSRGVIAAWAETADPAMRSVALYEAASGRLIASNKLPEETVRSGLDLTVSPKGEFAAAGPLLVRLSDGKTDVVDKWATIRSDSKNLYGTRNGTKMFWNGELPPMEMDQKAVVPWGMSNKRFAIVMDPLDTSRVRIGALTEG